MFGALLAIRHLAQELEPSANPARFSAPHSARRTFIANAAKKISTVGGSLRDVQMFAGHSSLAVTQRYIEGDSEARRKIVDLL